MAADSQTRAAIAAHDEWLGFVQRLGSSSHHQCW
jgi:hypothetical protein